MKSRDERGEKYSKTNKILTPDHDKQKTPWVNLPHQSLEKKRKRGYRDSLTGERPRFFTIHL